jgi:transcriptional regulator with XRE-family HTH domain
MAIGRRRGKGIPLTDIDRRRIAAARDMRGWSVAELASRVGLHQSTLYRLENGTLRSTPKLRSIYAALDLPTDRMGKADADEEELLTLYRRLKKEYPSQAHMLVNTARNFARRAVNDSETPVLTAYGY